MLYFVLDQQPKEALRMTICLPTIQPHHTVLTKAAILVFNWTAWIIPAFADSVADDVGDRYQGALAFIVSFCLAVAFVLGMVAGALGWGIPFLLLLELTSYLFFGLIYHLHERAWK